MLQKQKVTIIMKKLYEINNWALIITILLCFTFWGGIIALPILGLIQIIMSLIIIFHYKNLKKSIKILFIIYVILTLSSTKLFELVELDFFAGMILFAISSLFLASFHVYITYKISIQ